MITIGSILGIEETALKNLMSTLDEFKGAKAITNPEAALAVLKTEADERDEPALDIRDGVAIIPLKGVFVSEEEWWMKYWGGFCAVDSTIKLIKRALSNDQVKSIILFSDSPGGEVTGTHELAEFIYQSRSKKPIYTYVYGMQASAAYWAGSSADLIVSSPTAIIGSIGVVMTIVDFSTYYRKVGINVYDILSTKSPNKRTDPSNAEGRKKYVKMLDDTMEVFLSGVMRNRNMTEAQVLEAGDKGWIKVGHSAMQAGLIDGVMTFENFLQLVQTNSGEQVSQAVANQSLKQEYRMSEEKNQLEASAGTSAEEQNTQEMEASSNQPTPTKTEAENKTGPEARVTALGDQVLQLAKDIGVNKDQMEKLEGVVKNLQESIGALEKKVKTYQDEDDESDPNVTGSSSATGEDWSGCAIV